MKDFIKGFKDSFDWEAAGHLTAILVTVCILLGAFTTVIVGVATILQWLGV